MNIKQVKVGVGVIVLKNDKVLLGFRQGSHGHNTWSFPGGHLEFNESPEDCAKREVKEECDIEITNVERGPWVHDIFKEEQKCYVTLFLKACYKTGEVNIMEPEKCAAWNWFLWDDLPQPLFKPVQSLLIKAYDPFVNF